MNTYFFTFGAGQYLGLLQNSYVKIYATTYQRAREIMFEAFGVKWANQYMSAEFEGQAVRYNLTCLGTLDTDGNLVRRADVELQ